MHTVALHPYTVYQTCVHVRPSDLAPRCTLCFQVNTLRNVAIDNCRTQYIALVDADFVPNDGLYESLLPKIPTWKVHFGAFPGAIWDLVRFGTLRVFAVRFGARVCSGSDGVVLRRVRVLSLIHI
eukprot:1423899-Rhodomonas_salina.1